MRSEALKNGESKWSALHSEYTEDHDTHVLNRASKRGLPITRRASRLCLLSGVSSSPRGGRLNDIASKARQYAVIPSDILTVAKPSRLTSEALEHCRTKQGMQPLFS